MIVMSFVDGTALGGVVPRSALELERDRQRQEESATIVLNDQRCGAAPRFPLGPAVMTHIRNTLFCLGRHTSVMRTFCLPLDQLPRKLRVTPYSHQSSVRQIKGSTS